jgi:glycosyltransferase involved in cell wall biosynthesis
MQKIKVCLIGGDNSSWALDDDLRLTRRALDGIVEISTLKDCDVIHSVSWMEVVKIPKNLLIGKHVICHIPGEPFRYLSIPYGSKAIERVNLWIAQSSQAHAEMTSLGIESTLIPYTINFEIFHSIQRDESELIGFREKWAIPENSYIIGNFHRDTESHDLISPKLVKGPDVFIEIIRSLREKDFNIHVLLAGPRRFWIRRRLEALSIPFTFIGSDTEKQDDIEFNILPQKILNILYNLIDLYLVCSRSEGGPRSILEATASKCKIISSKVGLAQDVLRPRCIFSSPSNAVGIIAADIRDDHLAKTIIPHFEHILRYHQPKAVKPLFQDVYSQIDRISPIKPQTRLTTNHQDLRETYLRSLERSTYVLRTDKIGQLWRRYLKPVLGSGTQRMLALLYKLKRQPDALTISLWHNFVKPPYGGGNQFMLALRKALGNQGLNVVENQLHTDIDVYLLNAIHFDIDSFLKYGKQDELRIIHRIDGPIHLIRGKDRDKDELCFELNEKFASATVIQSAWTYQRIVEMGYQPVNPVIIHNGVDSDIFHKRGRAEFRTKRKIRLISSSWSDNPRKGGLTYKWLDQNLDWGRFEYTFVGRSSESFENIRQIPPVPSEQLAEILRQHDIFITASQNDPCSNALIEALACGLPALYFNDGGHPELVGFGGLPFDNNEEIFPQLDILIENYEMYQNLIVVSSIDDVAKKYLPLCIPSA